jgi:hypothetical protein
MAVLRLSCLFGIFSGNYGFSTTTVITRKWRRINNEKDIHPVWATESYMYIVGLWIKSAARSFLFVTADLSG